MTILRQHTLKRETTVEGHGVHTGKRCSVRIMPSPPHKGIRFINKKGFISADRFSLGDSLSSTCLVSGKYRVETVEHLLSCLYGLFIGNAIIEVSGKELPIGDGSSKIFYDAIMEAGVEAQDTLIVNLVVTRPFKVAGDKNRYIAIEPWHELDITYSLDWHPNIKGEFHYVHKPDNYSSIAMARTFADKKYISTLKRKKKARGTKFGVNTIDINDSGSFDREECLKHKVLDLLGDISLLFGFYINGKITAHNAGHALHHELVKEILNGSTSKRNH
jgi:UDP-3-O-[3-hydroxymyristoyl] N-acetylglucosamine deacetylase